MHAAVARVLCRSGEGNIRRRTRNTHETCVLKYINKYGINVLGARAPLKSRLRYRGDSSWRKYRNSEYLRRERM